MPSKKRTICYFNRRAAIDPQTAETIMGRKMDWKSLKASLAKRELFTPEVYRDKLHFRKSRRLYLKLLKKMLAQKQILYPDVKKSPIKPSWRAISADATTVVPTPSGILAAYAFTGTSSSLWGEAPATPTHPAPPPSPSPDIIRTVWGPRPLSVSVGEYPYAWDLPNLMTVWARRREHLAGYISMFPHGIHQSNRTSHLDSMQQEGQQPNAGQASNSR